MTVRYKIFVFKSCFLTIKAEQALKKAGLWCKVAIMSHMNSCCGIALRVRAEDEPRASRIVGDSGIESQGVWSFN
ncbi:MAG: DUF3343 domain-containing protein [Nitrospirota bacterium]